MKSIIEQSSDRSDMYRFLVEFDNQWDEAIFADSNRDYSAVREYKNIQRIIIAGMGGSAIAGEIVSRYASLNLAIPVFIVRNYQLPLIKPNDLVICASYSGNTEETLSAFSGAIGNCRVIGISSGGELAKRCRAESIPHFLLPKGFPPRCAFGHSLITLSGILKELNLGFGDFFRELKDLSPLIRENINRWKIENNNFAVQIASFLQEGIPLIYTETGLMESVGVRWRGQISENAKILAYNSAIPEMNHNEIVGWDNSFSHIGNFRCVMLRTSNCHPRNSRRMDLVSEHIGKNCMIAEIDSRKSEVENVISFIQLGDFVSYYLAMLKKIDPSPVKTIDWLKSQLA
ncbi:MAG: bifunctional phosphoglucose/phosphomannose isomerase [Candidatus Marinimicrobia bacterium]|nr:bifunctional phosphoglucose/phosphomannose isomerase [Candidatus Neomarinimicrobiota bacterium]